MTTPRLILLTGCLAALLLNGCLLQPGTPTKGRSAAPIAQRNTRLYHYDAYGNLIGYTRQHGERLYHYDVYGNRTGFSRERGGRLYHYDAHGNQTGSTPRSRR